MMTPVHGDPYCWDCDLPHGPADSSHDIDRRGDCGRITLLVMYAMKQSPAALWRGGQETIDIRGTWMANRAEV